MTFQEMLRRDELNRIPILTRTDAEAAELAKLNAQAKRELPHDDPTTPNVDEGETEIARELRLKVEGEQRLADFGDAVKEGAKDIAREVGPTLFQMLLGWLKGVIGGGKGGAR